MLLPQVQGRELIYHMFRLDETMYFLLIGEEEVSLDGYSCTSVRDTRRKDAARRSCFCALDSLSSCELVCLVKILRKVCLRHGTGR